MDVKLYDLLEDRDEHRHFRASFLTSAFCKRITMQAILDDPADALDELSTIRGVGETSMSRLRQVLVREFSTRFPEDWAAALAAHTQGTEPASGQARLLARFIRLWDVVAEFVPLTGRFYPDYEKSSNRVMLESLVRGEPFIYACESFPEILKTPEVLFAKQGKTPDKAGYQKYLSGLRAQMPPLAPGSLVVMNARALDDLLAGAGYYAALSDADRMAQVHLLLGFAASMPDLGTCIIDYRKAGLSSGFLPGEGPLLHYCFGGYIEVSSPDLVEIFRARVEAARAAGQTLTGWAAGHGIIAPAA